MFSFRLWRKKDEPIAKVLKELQSDINNHEIRASSLRQRQRSVKGQITLYAVLVYLAYLVYYALGHYYQLKNNQTLLIWALKQGAVILFPGIAYVLRRTIEWWYTRKIDKELQEKEILKTRLEEKLEELKEKSDYYNTQQLLERYDQKSISSSPKPKGPSSPHEPSRHPAHQPHLHKPSGDNIRQQPNPNSLETTLRQRGSSRVLLPPLPPQISPQSFVSPSPHQNIPQFHPSAFSPPPSPILPTFEQQSHEKTFLDRILDLLVGEDENSPEHRYALICRHCRAHNGLAPPGERPDTVGYLCGRCGGWNGPDPNKRPASSSNKEVESRSVVEEQEGKDRAEGGDGVEAEAEVEVEVAPQGVQDKGNENIGGNGD